MSLQVTPLTLMVLLIVNGVGAQYGWGVIYKPEYICALKGSNVTMSCTYSYPWDHTVKTAFWSKELVRGVDPPDLLKEEQYKSRAQYIGNKDHDCSLSLSDVRESDQSKYYFRFITDKEGGKYQGRGGVYLSVTGLQVEVPERVMEGDKVTLTCKTSCRLTDRTSFTWYRNEKYISSSTNQLHLQSVSRENRDRYSCGAWSWNLFSPEIPLDVLYGPKSISVSISPSGKIVEGSSVTLTCSSDGNPPVEYYWYKGTSLVTKGENFTLNNISSVNSEGYKCKSSNTHGEKYSDAVTLKVLYPPKNTSVSISPSGEIVEGSSVTLTCSSDGNPPVQKYTWFKDGGSSPVGSGHSYSFTLDSESSGQYYCEAQNEHGSRGSEAVLLNFKRSVTLYVIGGVVVGCVGLILVLVILFIRRKRRDPVAEDPKTKEESIYNNVAANQDDGLYATVEPPRPMNPRTEKRSAVSHEEVQYGNIQHCHRQDIKMTEEDDVQYASVNFSRTSQDHRNAPEDSSVIYSGVK
ncbi:B-cell receptor CD22-like isoform X1 [Astyanax mexicanus]|uniref:B-cell receptor CD22-like isoform X1 n=1 Tax=Astyanax mexicanus TaxID=7994 RepID=A0A8T2KTP7_ASTMX|nr:B-cell receptor CD22-like isoform X1 [Astyanax mexicanus]